MSGVPGREETFFLKRYPRERRIFLTRTSGFVSLARIRPMISDRLAAEKISVPKCRRLLFLGLRRCIRSNVATWLSYKEITSRFLGSNVQGPGRSCLSRQTLA